MLLWTWTICILTKGIMQTFEESGVDRKFWNTWKHLFFSTFEEQDEYLFDEQRKYEFVEGCAHSFRHAGGIIPTSDSSQEHYVYMAVVEGEPVYIGSGKGDRHKHVNSGVSHNYGLNQLHFSGVRMEVLAFKENLTKTESEKLEKELIAYYNPAKNTTNKQMYMKDNGKSPHEAGWRVGQKSPKFKTSLDK